MPRFADWASEPFRWMPSSRDAWFSIVRKKKSGGTKLNIQRFKYISVCAILLSSGFAFAERLPEPKNVVLVDLTDADKASGDVLRSGDLLSPYGGEAFDIKGDVPSAITNLGKQAASKAVGFQKTPASITYYFKTPTVVNAYRIYNQVGTSGGGTSVSSRSPKDFTLEGYNSAEKTWVVLDEVKNLPSWKALEARYFEFDNQTAYDRYRLRFLSSQGGGAIVIQQAEFFTVPRNRLLITGTPGNCGTVCLSYGEHLVEVDSTVRFSAPAQVSLDDGALLATCTGWSLYRQGIPETFITEGTGTVSEFQMPGYPCRLEWKFALSRSDSASGAAVFVSPDGSDLNNDGSDYEKPLATIATAISKLSISSSADKNGTVYLLPGTYGIKNELQLAAPIAVKGLTGNPSDVTIRNVTNATATVKSRRVFVLNHPNAALSGLTLEHGQSYSAGGTAAILSNGGTISNCILRSGMVRSENGRGAGVYMNSDAALLTHCRVEDCSIGNSSTPATDGLGAYIDHGRISNTLFTRNARKGTYQGILATNCSIVRILDGLLDNCTIVDNLHTGLVAAVRADATARVVNCVMAANCKNATGLAIMGWDGAPSSFVNCATDDAAPINDACRIGTANEFFANYAQGDYTPRGGGVLQDGGTIAGLVPPTVDLANESRQRGENIDIGCYESMPRRFLLRIR